MVGGQCFSMLRICFRWRGVCSPFCWWRCFPFAYQSSLDGESCLHVFFMRVSVSFFLSPREDGGLGPKPHGSSRQRCHCCLVFRGCVWPSVGLLVGRCCLCLFSRLEKMEEKAQRPTVHTGSGASFFSGGSGPLLSVSFFLA